ncbi:MAG: FkbM family methyltransferase [Pseudomonadales bacterium]|nr:FkbM family methyltransferase [Pseudomonadales bacterium]MCP5185867.1 FkbM family methyltransferase [Pseudomonadales bacterium]
MKRFLLWYARHGVGKALRRSALRKFRRQARGQAYRVRTRDGVLLDLEVGDSVDNAIIVHGEFEPLTSALFRQLAPAVQGLVDVGCNLGYFATLFAHLRPGVPVVAVDANPAMAARARGHASLNALHAVDVHAVGLAARPGRLTLMVPAARHSLASFAYAAGDDKQADVARLTVPVTTLPALLAGRPAVSHLLVKIDTEGYEAAILDGLDDSVIGRIDALLMEVNFRNLRRAGVQLETLLGHDWLDAFAWFFVDDASARLTVTSRAALLTTPSLNGNCLFLRPALVPLLQPLLRS